MAIGACRSLVDNVAFDSCVQRVVDSEGITADVRAESEVVDKLGFAGGAGVEG